MSDTEPDPPELDATVGEPAPESGEAPTEELGARQLDEELDLFAQLHAAEDSAGSDLGEGLSLEELSQSYASVIAQDTEAQEEQELDPLEDQQNEPAPSNTSAGESESEVPTSPRSIIESVLFVGRPDSSRITAAELAKLMRGVTDDDVRKSIRELNEIYEQSERAICISEHADGYQLGLREDMEYVRDGFYGPTREISLNQDAIDCLALVAYQPGISRNKIDEQRSQPSGGILNQLVRRSLIEIRREVEGKKKVAHYFPTQKLIDLTGMGSLEDLPQVEDLDAE